ncbi:MAG: biotin--[acetyl-CoA-carboxylase] ligase [Actinomycetota bacterium]|nr:biotin--[acetyl-CoA-carboxylase] ligase [Actinomycetota bacterium]
MSWRSPIDADTIRAEAGERWARVVVVEQTGSSNADLLADGDAPDRSVLVAELQVAGRGRLDRQWISPAGAGLTFSVLLRPAVAVMAWGWLPLLAGVALHNAVMDTGVSVTLKWPNDLLADGGPHSGRKLAGILAQASGEAVVIGIGLNVSNAEHELATQVATSLALCGAGETDRNLLLAEILRKLDARLARWSRASGDADACGLAAAYRDSCATIGQHVAVTTGDSVIRGRAVGVDESGRLVLDVAGVRQVIGAGDVEHVRPA